SLRKWHIDVRFDRTGQPDEPRIGSDADNRYLTLFALVRHNHLLAQWILARPNRSRHRFVDNCDPLRARRVRIGEIATTDDREFQRSKQSWLDDVPVRLEALPPRRCFTGGLDAAESHPAAVERQIDRQRGALH